MDTYLVAYDICHPKRLRKSPAPAKTSDFGVNTRCFFAALRNGPCTPQEPLYDIINLQEDQVLFIPLCASAPIKSRRWDGLSRNMIRRCGGG